MERLEIPAGGVGGSHSLGHCSVISSEVEENAFGGVIEDCGHWICEEAPKDLLRFVSELDSRLSWA